MFEKEAEEYANQSCFTEMPNPSLSEDIDISDEIKEAVLYGYNKANEWHYVADDDLPKVDNKIVLCVCGDGYMDGKGHYILKLLTRKEFPLFQPVYTWKEIVLPEEIKGK